MVLLEFSPRGRNPRVLFPSLCMGIYYHEREKNKDIKLPHTPLTLEVYGTKPMK